jgi:hypothetical protein
LFSCEAKVARRTWWTFNQCTWGFMIQQSKNDLDIWKCLFSSNGFEPKYNFMCGVQICSMPPTSSWRMQAFSNQDRSCILTYAGKWVQCLVSCFSLFAITRWICEHVIL